MNWKPDPDTSDLIDLRDNTSFRGRLKNALYNAQGYGYQLLNEAKREYQAGVDQKNGLSPLNSSAIIGFQGNPLAPQNPQRVIPQKMSIY
jgi:hypothetical protein